MHSGDREYMEKCLSHRVYLDTEYRIELAKRFYTDRFELLKYYTALCFRRGASPYAELETLNPTTDELNMLGKIYVEKMIEYPDEPITKKIIDKLTDRQLLEEIQKHSHSWVQKLVLADKLSADRKQMMKTWSENLLTSYEENLYLIEAIKPGKDDLFLLGQMTGDILHKSRSSHTADLLIRKIKELNSTSFEDGVFSQGDIEYTRNVQVERMTWSIPSNANYDQDGYPMEVDIEGEDRFEDQTFYLTRDGIKKAQ
jgi:hypothetical protein